MKKLFTLAAITLSLVVALAGTTAAQDKKNKPVKEKGFKTIWDGKTFNGWKISEPEKNSWSIQDGAIVAKGPRSHLFYVADPKPFVNFEYKVEAMTEPGSNGGIYFHTQWQETGFPKMGFSKRHPDFPKLNILTRTPRHGRHDKRVRHAEIVGNFCRDGQPGRVIYVVKLV